MKVVFGTARDTSGLVNIEVLSVETIAFVVEQFVGVSLPSGSSEGEMRSG